MKKNQWLGGFFALIFLGLLTLFAFGLGHNPNALSLATKGSKIPAFSLPALLADKTLTNADLTAKQPYYLVNFFGSWCPSCYEEHPYLIQLSRHETLYGINWKDAPADGKHFLQNGGNPYDEIIVDAHSVLAIGMGVYGAPETFLIRADGTIVYRYAGALNERVWQAEFVPRIATLE